MRMCRVASIILVLCTCLIMTGFVFSDKESQLQGFQVKVEKMSEESLVQEGKNEQLQREMEDLRAEMAEIRERNDKMSEEKESLEKEVQRLGAEKESLQTQHEKSLSLQQTKRKVICKKREVAGKKPIFIFVVGGEGTGHHLVANLLEKCPGVYKFPRHVQQLFAEMWEPAINEERRYEKRSELLTLLQEASAAFYNGQANSTHYVIQSSDFDMYSFPYDDPRNPLRRPDVLDLLSMVEPLFDLRIVVTIRDQMNSIVSLIRRKWWTLEMCERGVLIPNRKVWLYTDSVDKLGECGYIPVQARVVEDALIYISAHIQTISREYFQSIRYEELLDNPSSFAQPLSQFLSLSQPALEEILPAHVTKKKENYQSILTPKQRETIETVFGGNRAEQWKFMMQERHHVLNYDPQDLSWKAEEECFSG